MWVFFPLLYSDSRAPNLERSTCTTISGCYSPENPSRWTRGSLTSWNLSPRCQETPNILPECDPCHPTARLAGPFPPADVAAPCVLPLEEVGGAAGVSGETEGRTEGATDVKTWRDLTICATCKRSASFLSLVSLPHYSKGWKVPKNTQTHHSHHRPSSS